MTDPAATAPPANFPCPRCGNVLTLGQLVCPFCGALVYADALNALAAEAQQAEAASPVRAVMLWKHALTMLPPDSQQYRMVNERIGQLASGLAFAATSAAPGDAPASPEAAEQIVRPPDPLG